MLTFMSPVRPYPPRKQWSKKREMRRKRKRPSRTHSTSSFCISAAPLWRKKGLIMMPSLKNVAHRSYCMSSKTICPNFSKLDTDHLYMAYADIMAKVSHCRGFWPWPGVSMKYFEVWCISSAFLELPHWWGRRRGRGNGGKWWRWEVLWGATVRTGNGRPGAGDQEHSGAVALGALSDIIISTLLHHHISPSLFLSSVLSPYVPASCNVS